jgi:hypothetical protein
VPLWQWAQVQEVLLELDEGTRASRRAMRLMPLRILRCPGNSRSVVNVSGTLETYHWTREIAGPGDRNPDETVS